MEYGNMETWSMEYIEIWGMEYGNIDPRWRHGNMGRTIEMYRVVLLKCTGLYY